MELRGQVVKDAVQAEVPPWAEPIVWAGDLPLVWAGEIGPTKALILALPLSTDDSRLPLSAAFPLLMRNACRWMLPPPPCCGRRAGCRRDLAPRRADRAAAPGAAVCLQPADAAESDLRRETAAAGAPPARRRSLAFALVALAVCSCRSNGDCSIVD